MSSAKDYAFRLLGLRRMTEAEVRKKLLARKYPLDEIDEAIEACIYYGYINDADYAKCYVSDAYSLKKWGKKRIFLELKKKGISEGIIETAFFESQQDEMEILREYVERKYEDVFKMDWKNRKKVLGALLRRGFSFENIQTIMNTHDLTEEDYE